MSEVEKIYQSLRGTRPSLDGLSLVVQRGQVHGLVGANGAGKTTLLRMIAGQVRPTAGQVRVFGQDPWRSRSACAPRTAAVLEPSLLSPALSARANIRYLAGVLGVPLEVHPVLDEAGLEVDERPVSQFSLGMRARLAIGVALALRTDLLVLDEPFNGLDPPGLHWARGAIIRAAERGGTVLLSSHLLNEMAPMCSHITVMHRGRQVFTGATGDLIGAGANARVDVTVAAADAERAERLLRSAFGTVDRTTDGRFGVDGATGSEVNRVLGQAGIWASEVSGRSSLEAVYLDLVSRHTAESS